MLHNNCINPMLEWIACNKQLKIRNPYNQQIKSTNGKANWFRIPWSKIKTFNLGLGGLAMTP